MDGKERGMRLRLGVKRYNVGLQCVFRLIPVQQKFAECCQHFRVCAAQSASLFDRQNRVFMGSHGEMGMSQQGQAVGIRVFIGDELQIGVDGFFNFVEPQVDSGLTHQNFFVTLKLRGLIRFSFA